MVIARLSRIILLNKINISLSPLRLVNPDSQHPRQRVLARGHTQPLKPEVEEEAAKGAALRIRTTVIPL